MSKLIMVVDDDQDILELYQELFGEEGYRVKSFSAWPTDYMSLFNKYQPDVVIMDLMLNNQPLDWQFIQQLRSEPTTARLPLILCSGELRRVGEMEERLRQSNVTVIHKPFDIDQLVAAVNLAADQLAYC